MSEHKCGLNLFSISLHGDECLSRGLSLHGLSLPLHESCMEERLASREYVDEWVLAVGCLCMEIVVSLHELA